MKLKTESLLTIVAVLAVLMTGVFSLYQKSFAINGEECVITSWTEDELVWPEYRCASDDCGTNILQRERRRVRSCWSDSCGGGGCDPWLYYYTDPVTYKDLDSWVRCDPGQTDWQMNVPSYNCQGDCLEAPTNLRYNGRVSNSNVDLPVELSWTNVPGFGKEKGPVSYLIKIDNTNFQPGDSPQHPFLQDYDGTKGFPTLMPPFSFSYPKERNPFSTNLKSNRFLADKCLLRSSDAYNWSVRACCNLDGTNCGPPAEDSILTSNKIEPLKQGTGAGTSGDPETIHRLEDANLRWCEMRVKETTTIWGKEEIVYFPVERYEVVVEKKVPLLWARYRIHPIVKAMGGSIIRRASPPWEKTPPTHVKNEEFFLFTKSDYAHYRWRVRACKGAVDTGCKEWTSWRYLIVSDKVTIDAPNLLIPSDDPQGNNARAWPINFRWGASLGANSYRFQIYELNPKTGKESLLLDEIVGGTPLEDEQIARVHQVTLPRDDIELKLNTSYRWRVKSCWDTRTLLCEKEWSERHFKTTGRPPVLKNPETNTENILIPLQLSWEMVPGARSYLLNFNGNETVVVDNRADIGYSVLKQNTLYTWSVRTCNDSDGKTCGERSEVRLFRTLVLAKPQDLKPTSADYFTDQHNRIDLSWGKVLGAHYYNLSISCGGSVVFNEITSETKRSVPLGCVGENHWTVRACIDKNCNDAGDLSEGRFVLHEGTTTRTGLVPCGLIYNNPNTPWNEREPCQFRHLFIMLKVILDFLFWNLMPLVLVIMVVVSGLTFYLSLGDPNAIVRIKAIWSSVGKGLLIMFFGWTAISIIMATMGYTGIFGPWWQVSF